MTSGENVLNEQLVVTAEVDRAAIKAVESIATPLLSELSNPDSVLYAVAAKRIAGMSSEGKLGIAPLLLTDPYKSGVVVERYRLQSGSLPEDAIDDSSIERTVALWSSAGETIPKLEIPEGAETAIMTIADALQMRGGGSVIFDREHAKDVPVLPNTVVHINGAANNAPRERITTALAFLEARGSSNLRMVATADASRVLKAAELEKVADFASGATNELELMIASAIDKGFIASETNPYGTRHLADGSTYTVLHNKQGAELLILSPQTYLRADGTKQTGVFNAYQAALKNPGLFGQEFDFAASNVVHVTSSHYGPMAAINNLRAVHELRTGTASFHVIGDNQPGRTPQAHLVEIGLTADALQQTLQEPALRTQLLDETV